jgi:hypothetical protein
MKTASQKDTVHQSANLPPIWKKAAGILKRHKRKNESELKKIRQEWARNTRIA